MAIRDRTELRHRLQELAATQSGYFTAAQALEVGYAYPSQRYHVQRGNWQKIDRALFRLPKWPAARDEHLVRWSLWSGDEGVVSHDTALAEYELGNVNPPVVHLTVPKDFRKREAPGVELHRARLDQDDVRDRGGYRITTPVRALFDVAGEGLDPSELGLAVKDALDRGLVTRRSLRSYGGGAAPEAALGIERALSALDSR